MKKIISVILLLVIMMSCCLCACENDKDKSKDVSTANEVMSLEYYNKSDKKIGVVSGTIQEEILFKNFPNAEICPYNTLPDLVTALNAKNIDAFSCASSNFIQVNRENPSILGIEKPLATFDCAFAFPKTEKGAKLRDEFNEFLAISKYEGLIDSLNQKWIYNDSANEKVKLSDLKGDKGEIKFVTTGTTPPYSFLVNNQVSGFDVELAARFCRDYGYSLDIDTVDFSAIMAGLGSSKYDMAANCILVTEERKQSVNFSDTIYQTNIMLAVLSPNAKDNQNFFENIASSFEKTFIVDNRWELIVQGLLVTVIISVISVIIGTILGFLLCLVFRTKIKFFHILVNIYIKIFQGTPLLVILMILYYIVFANSAIDNVLVAIIAFSLNFAAYVCEILKSSIDAIDKGQMEAALSLGYTRRQGFMHIVLPQAIAISINVYRGQVISLVKLTSIVGYIAIQDLTKASDFIRSRTFEPFFPLIVTAIIYFLICALIAFVIKQIEKKLIKRKKLTEEMQEDENLKEEKDD